jgi:UDP:flavonoid glycosyltransferase YjiC (YdhE family)
VPQRDAGTAALSRTADQMLGDDRYRQHARRLKQVFASVDGAGAAAEAIIDLADQSAASGGRPLAAAQRGSA